MRAVEHSTIGSIGTVIAQAIEGAGGDYVALFTEVGLDLNTLRDPSVRISSDKMYRLLQLAEARCKDPLFGLHFAKYLHPTTFYSLGVSMYASETLGEYLNRYIKHYRLITTNNFISATLAEGVFELVKTDTPDEKIGPSQVDGFLAITVQSVRLALQSDFFPLSISVACRVRQVLRRSTRHFLAVQSYLMRP